MADQPPYLPGLSPPFNGIRADRFGRPRGPWKRPARVPCDYKRANGLICELESIATWCRNSATPGPLPVVPGSWHRHDPGIACGVNTPTLNRCALHPPVMGR
jgi:hypothetical protein